jgi:hypothetical protein
MRARMMCLSFGMDNGWRRSSAKHTAPFFHSANARAEIIDWSVDE